MVNHTEIYSQAYFLGEPPSLILLPKNISGLAQLETSQKGLKNGQDRGQNL